jgi:DNA mismatch repair protein MutS2
MVAAIQDRAERLKVERESQRRVAELKREAQRLARGVQPPQAFEAVAPGTPKRDVRVIRDGKVLQASQADVLPGEEESYVVSNARPIVVGDTVRLRTFGSTGIVDQIKDDEAEVRVKSLRFREKLENLELLEASAAPKKVTGRFSRLRPTRQTEVHLKATDEKPREELNVIGHTTDEAIDAVDKFLDESSLASLSHVRIVHGHGTGALRRAIGDLLKGHPHVMRFTTAPPDQGGGGATIVELRS